ncbi:MAG: hypothetical protein ACJ76Z_03255 [Thermoleophilaceae bacterium]
MSSTEQKKSEEAQKAEEAQERYENAQKKIEELEKDPPEKLEDWPDDAAKYQTFGGSEEGESVYDEKHEEALGEHSVRHHDDGSVEVKGEKADDPDEYKGDPIPGGPTDPDAPKISGERDLSEDGESDSDREGEEKD